MALTFCEQRVSEGHADIHSSFSILFFLFFVFFSFFSVAFFVTDLNKAAESLSARTPVEFHFLHPRALTLLDIPQVYII